MVSETEGDHEMSEFTWRGRYFKGAMRVRRDIKRDEAEARQAAVRPERTKRHRMAKLRNAA